MSDEPTTGFHASTLGEDSSHASKTRMASGQELSELEALQAAAQEYEKRSESAALKETQPSGIDLAGFEDWWVLQNGDG